MRGVAGGQSQLGSQGREPSQDPGERRAAGGYAPGELFDRTLNCGWVTREEGDEGSARAI